MPELTSYKQFSEYCLRALGEDEDLMIKVNVTPRQLRDRIEDAIKTWQDFHFEGSTEVSVKKDITSVDQENGYIDVPELNAITQIMSPYSSSVTGTGTGVQALDNIDYRFALEYTSANRIGFGGSIDHGLTDYHINREYLASLEYMFKVQKLFTFNATTNRLYLQNKETAFIGGPLVTDFRDGDWVVGTGTELLNDIEEMPDGNVTGSKVSNTDSGANPISMSFTATTTFYPRGMRSFNVLLKQGDYTGKVMLRVLDRAGNVIASKTVQPPTYWKKFEISATYKEPHINDFIFEISSTEAQSNQHFFAAEPNGYRNSFIICLGFATTSPDDVDTLWDSGWLREYAITLIKRQWGNNTKKFENIQMAGGVTMTGQTMYDEAITEMEQLKIDLTEKWSLPPAMIIG